MKIIIVGCGKVGTTLAKQLCKEGHDITVIDKKASRVRALSDGYDVLALEGDGSSYSCLRDAGVETADALIAVTDSDEKNLLCCLIARKTGNVAAIARVRNPVYNSEIQFFRKGFGLSMVINPEQAAAMETARVFRFPSAISIDTFSKGRVELLTFRLNEGNILVDKSLTYIHQKLKTDVLVVIVRRGGKTIVPSGNFVLKAGDLVSIISGPGQAEVFFRKIGLETDRVKNVMIIGGGKVTHYLAKRLMADNIAVKIICQMALLRKEGRRIEDLIADLKQPAESEEIRYHIGREDFRLAGENVLNDFRAFCKADPRFHLVVPNFEGIRVSFDDEEVKGWLLLRMSLHDPVLPLNLESKEAGGTAVIRQRIAPFFEQYDWLS